MSPAPPLIEPPEAPMRQTPSPGNNLMLRQMEGMRRDMRELMERKARGIELMNPIALQMDEGFTRLHEEIGRVRRDLNDVWSDLVLMENRVLTAIGDVRHIAARTDEMETELRQALGDTATPSP